MLQGVDWTIPTGAVVGLLGTNGAGKSTLLKCMLGLLRPTSGSVSLFGEDAWELSAEAKARLSYVPQEVKLYPWMRVRHIVDYTAAFYPSWDEDWVAMLMERWEVPWEPTFNTLSTGQAQKLALVLAMGHQPDLLILDEPVASLDPMARRTFLRSMLELSSDPDRTVLFSSHITSDLERVATHVAVLQEGRISCFEELDTLKEQVKRLRIEASQPLPASFEVQGAIHTQVDGHRALVAVADWTPPRQAILEQDWQARVEVEDLNLEEIFLELHREQRT